MTQPDDLTDAGQGQLTTEQLDALTRELQADQDDPPAPAGPSHLRVTDLPPGPVLPADSA